MDSKPGWQRNIVQQCARWHPGEKSMYWQSPKNINYETTLIILGRLTLKSSLKNVVTLHQALTIKMSSSNGGGPTGWESTPFFLTVNIDAAMPMSLSMSGNQHAVWNHCTSAWSDHIKQHQI